MFHRQWKSLASLPVAPNRGILQWWWGREGVLRQFLLVAQRASSALLALMLCFELPCGLFHCPVFFPRQCFWSGTASMTLCLAGWVTECSLARSSKWSSLPQESGKLFSLWGRWCQIGSFKMMAWEWFIGHGTLKYLLFMASLKLSAHECCFSTWLYRGSHTPIGWMWP